MSDNRWNHSDRDDQYPQDERPYRQNDFMGDSYYRNGGAASSSQRTSEDARAFYTNQPQDQSRGDGSNQTRGRKYAAPRDSGARTLERGRYMDRDSASGMDTQDTRETYRADLHQYDRGAGSSRARTHLGGSDYGGQDWSQRGPQADRYGAYDNSSRAVESDLNMGSSYSTTTSYNAGPIYGEPSNYNDGLDMGAFTSTTGVRSTRRESFTGRGPKNYKRSDERVREDASEALSHHHEIDASEIEVDVKDGVVTLRGEVDHRSTKRMAEDSIEHLSGVKDVRNELTVNKSFFERAKEMLMGETDRPTEKATQVKSKH
jgi:osmotically-inducible protein OsmY